MAGDASPAGGKPDRYQVFFGAPLGNGTVDAPALGGEDGWRLLPNGSGSQDVGVTFFTPRLTGVDLGIGLSGNLAERSKGRDGLQPDPSGRNWRVGGSVGTSTVRLGAAFGDHADPTCREAAACATNDFWDIGLSWRFGSGAVSAGYTSSQRRLPNGENPESLGIFSLSAGYRVAPGVDVFGGIDWIELPAAETTPEEPRNTRFMLGTSLRF